MTRLACAALLVWMSSACDGAAPPAQKPEVAPTLAPAKAAPAPTPEVKPIEATTPTKIAEAPVAPPVVPPPVAPEPIAVAEPTPAEPVAAAEPTPAEPTPAEPVAVAEPAPAEPTSAEPTPATPGIPEIAIKPWATSPHAPAWTLVAEPGEPLVLTGTLRAGVLGRAGGSWYSPDAAGKLAVVTLDRDPRGAVLGTWPSDAWFVDERWRKYDHGDELEQQYLEIRLMRLRGGKRWVPQDYHGEQWFHPGTDDEVKPHISTWAGMLLYPDSLTAISRISDSHADPLFGAHRGDVVTFIENLSGKVYLLTRDEAGLYACVPCEDEACVEKNTRKLPAGAWSFGRKLARGKHSVSMYAANGEAGYMLHHRGKADGWLLDELPAGERPTMLWASDEGGVWASFGEQLRWRDVEGVWRDITLPAGLTTPSFTVSADRKTLWISGTVAGAAKVFTTPANAQPTAP